MNPCCEAIKEILHEDMICKCFHTSETSRLLLSDHVRQWRFDCGEKYIASEMRVWNQRDMRVRARRSDLRSGGFLESIPAEEVVVLTMAEGSVFSRWTLVFARPPASVMDVNLPSEAHKCWHTSRCFKGGCPVLNGAARVLGGACQRSLSCQADLRWQVLWTGRDVLYQMLLLHGHAV